ncbi:MAG: alpha/beta fold hydrolase [Anaerolineae bacterium]
MQIVEQADLSMGSRKLNYLLHLPPDYAQSHAKKWPIILFLHGMGERGNEPDHLERLKKHGLPRMLESRGDFPFIVVSPQCPGESWWPYEVHALNAFLDDIVERYPVDLSRIYLTGLSMGGFGTWGLAAMYPHRFAAIAPICGGGIPAMAAALKDLPIWAFHGALDEIVPLSNSEKMVDALRALGANVRFTVYPDLMHDSWTVTYDNPELYSWFMENQRA